MSKHETITVRIDAREEAEKFLADVGLDLRQGWREARIARIGEAWAAAWLGLFLAIEAQGWWSYLIGAIYVPWVASSIVRAVHAHRRVKDTTP